MKKNRTEELLKEKLREKGLKVTNQRILILSVLEQNKGRHLTAEDIYELVTQEHPEIGLATVYRTIQLLWDMQLIDKINLDEGCKVLRNMQRMHEKGEIVEVFIF